MDKNIFNILRGMENETLKGAWGKSYLLEEGNIKDNYNTNNKKVQSSREGSSIFANYSRGYRFFGLNEPSSYIIMENEVYLQERMNSELALKRFDIVKSTVPILTYSKNLTYEI